MKKIVLLALALMALFVIPATASAVTHHKKPLKCKAPKHRNGHKCVNKPIGGPAGSQGPPGSPGSPGVEGPPGPPAPSLPVVYNNIEPASLIDNPVSLGYAATGTTEFGSQVVLTEEVTSPEVEVLMSVWTCETGEWNIGCVTTNPAATFSASLTLNVYAVTYENAVGALLTSKTQAFNLPFRPTSDATCSDPTSFEASDGHCQHGLPVPVKFDLGAASVPRKAIVSVSFTPSGSTNSLNVGVEGPPTVGQNPLESREGIYWDSQWYGTPGPFSLEEESGEWKPGESQAAIKVLR